MTREELVSIITKIKFLKLTGVMLTKPIRPGWYPKGEKIRTPFGLCKEYGPTFDEAGKEVGVLFFVTLEQLEKFLRRADQQESERAQP